MVVEVEKVVEKSVIEKSFTTEFFGYISIHIVFR